MNRYVVGVLSATALLVAGCGTEASGTSEPTTEQPTTVAFNPCDELSTEALQAADLDPDSKSTSVDSPNGEASAWKICRWKPVDGQPYAVGVGSSTFSQDSLADNPTVTGFEDVRIGARAGKTYYQSGDRELLRCYVSVPAPDGGMHNVILSWRTSQKETIPESPPCSLAVEKAKELEPFLP